MQSAFQPKTHAMRHFVSLAACAALLLVSPLLQAQDDGAAAVELEVTKQAPDPSVATRLAAKGTPYSVDDDGDYRILVNVGEDRSQLVWVRSIVHKTDAQHVREIWTYGLRSEERRIPAHIANRLLSENMVLIVGAWARQHGNAILVLKINADADADTLDEAIDLAASIGDRMEKRLGTGDEL